MKKFLKSAGLPIGVFALAIGSAFATNAMKNVDPLIEDGYIQIDGVETNCDFKMKCQTFGNEKCTWQESPTKAHTLYSLEGTACVRELARIGS
ncbi:hypothetical protein HX071_03370 [Myroides marinus]|uniref:DUF6520 family protein n=1 Tax=Myroides TaxID=76831 RepID=UPI000EFD5F8A|nr:MULTISPECIES: DUF6520 family protein [Myroides]MDM1501241.1 hypothetical protein [Myroides marinus]